MCCIIIGVPLFFLSNGYLLMSRPFNLKKHMRKMIHIVCLTFVWGFINVICLMIIDQEYLSAKEILISVWQWRAGKIDFLWFMGTLVSIYLFVPLLKNAYDYNLQIFLFLH